MPLPKLRLGVIGCGRMGALHLQKFLQNPNCEISGVFDIDTTRAHELSKRYSVAVFSNLSELLFESEGIVISTPTPSHSVIAQQALRAGVSALIEKPAATTALEVQQLQDLALETGGFVHVGFLERYRWEALIQPELVFDSDWIEFQRMSPSLNREIEVDVISDLMIHDLDLVAAYMNEEPFQIQAHGMSLATPFIDICEASLQFASGRHVRLKASRVAPETSRKVFFYGKHQTTVVNFINNQVTKVRRLTNASPTVSYEGVTGESLKTVDPLALQCDDFIKRVLAMKQPKVSLNEAVRSMILSETIRSQIQAPPSQAEKVPSRWSAPA